MTVKEIKKFFKKINKNTVVKINGKDIKLNLAVNQDGEWTVNVELVDAEHN